jgi:integrative and conjugative element protein (TIGR02256 family)
MWKLSRNPVAKPVRVMIPRAALDTVYDECDGFTADETGGRLIGTFRASARGDLEINVTGIIEPGPNARRSATSFFQDGEHQEAVFRTVESEHPEVEHLGNWHTHHVNGYPTLSGGDRTTYHRIVNHKNHHTDFFYALLVTKKNDAHAKERYTVKHFIVFRDEDGEFEIPDSHVMITDDPIWWPAQRPVPGRYAVAEEPTQRTDQRVKDQAYFSEFHPEFKPFTSKSTGGLYWKGALELVDERPAQIAIAEIGSEDDIHYSSAIKLDSDELAPVKEELGAQKFKSARSALRSVERKLNRAIYQLKK